MKTLLLLRHAKSSWDDDSLSDHDRPLNRRGERDAPRIGALLREEKLLPQIILSSTAVRARETVERLTPAAGYEGPVLLEPHLYMASPEDYRRVVATMGLDAQTVLVVGHNPGLSIWLSQLCDVDENLPTAALAQVALKIDDWEKLTNSTRGRLKQLWRPRELDD